MALSAVARTRPTWPRVVLIVLGGWVLLALALTEVAGIVGDHGIGSDFVAGVFHPAQAVAHGFVPYGDPQVPGPLAESVYPPSAFVPFAWLGLLGHIGAVTVWLLLMAAAAVATLWVLGVRDVRCYAVWLLTPMMLSTVAIGNATTLVILLVAVLWRWRDTAWIAAAALIAAIATKLFAAPLIVWLIATKRYRAAGLTAVGLLSILRIMTSDQVRSTFLEFFQANGHVLMPSSSLVPLNDPTVLLTPAGMHQMQPFFLGRAKPPAHGGLTISEVSHSPRVRRSFFLRSPGSATRVSSSFHWPLFGRSGHARGGSSSEAVSPGTTRRSRLRVRL